MRTEEKRTSKRAGKAVEEDDGCNLSWFVCWAELDTLLNKQHLLRRLLRSTPLNVAALAVLFQIASDRAVDGGRTAVVHIDQAPVLELLLSRRLPDLLDGKASI